MAADALVVATGSLGDVSTEVNGTEISVVLPADLTDISLFLDLLDYILPAGMTCRVIRRNEVKKSIDSVILQHTDTLKRLVADDFAVDTGYLSENGLASMYNIANDTNILDLDFTANITKRNGKTTPNTGLLNNTIIPAFANSVTSVIPQDTAETLYSTRGFNEDGTPIIDTLFAEDSIELRAKKFGQVQEV
jgi:hypothetical protein